MAAVRTSSEIALNRIAIASVLIATLIFLAPIYWIASTAFKPKELAVSVPPTVLFEPEVTPFVRLFTKRVQMQKTVDPQVYDAAPWWEKRIYDGGERVLKVGKDVQLSQYPDRFMNSLIVAVISTVLAVGMGTSKSLLSRTHHEDPPKPGSGRQASLSGLCEVYTNARASIMKALGRHPVQQA